MKFLPLVSKTIRLSLIRVGIGWMFALLTFNFNRVSMVDLGPMRLIVATLIGLHHFLSPFQVFWGRLADRYPLFGYRRTPYIVLSTLVGSLIFLALPSVEGSTGLYMGLWGMAQGLGNGSANVLGGALHTALIETHLLRPDAAYGLIFGLEALLMVAAVLVLRSISVQECKGLETNDLTSVMALDTAT
jgi:MFS family permease